MQYETEEHLEKGRPSEPIWMSISRAREPIGAMVAEFQLHFDWLQTISFDFCTDEPFDGAKRALDGRLTTPKGKSKS